MLYPLLHRITPVEEGVRNGKGRLWPYVSGISATGTLGKYGVMPWGLAPGSLGKYVLVCIVSFCFAEALLYNKQ